MSLFWELRQAGKMTRPVDLPGGRTPAGGVSSGELADLQARCDKALMVCEALWTILRDQLNLSEDDLIARVNEIDLSDGRLDGRAKKSGTVRCPDCDRTISQRFANCIYCGTAIVHDPFM